MSIKLLFFGTSSFAVPSLKALAKDPRFSILAVVTQPDRPVGRHAELQAPPVKEAATELGLPVVQFETVKSDEAFETLKNYGADIAVVASFGQIIPERVLTLTKLGMINVHASILPNYRGASPINEAIKQGDQETGVTIMKMDALLDHGPILKIATEPIHENDTTATLEPRLAKLGADILPDTLVELAEGKLEPVEQDHDKATKVKLLKREDGKIDWTRPAQEIERTVRAYQPWPGTFTEWNGKRLKILSAKIGSPSDKPAGSLTTDDGYPAIVCGDNTALQLIELQPEGKQAMDGKAFLAGHEWR
ncbi:MAG: methionyl-tRNA formyltransferase [bacterium]|nr:methionyl-tRNA formyltransferase [bacterium]